QGRQAVSDLTRLGEPLGLGGEVRDKLNPIRKKALEARLEALLAAVRAKIAGEPAAVPKLAEDGLRGLGEEPADLGMLPAVGRGPPLVGKQALGRRGRRGKRELEGRLARKDHAGVAAAGERLWGELRGEAEQAGGGHAGVVLP